MITAKRLKDVRRRRRSGLTELQGAIQKSINAKVDGTVSRVSHIHAFKLERTRVTRNGDYPRNACIAKYVWNGIAEDKGFGPSAVDGSHSKPAFGVTAKQVAVLAG
jgi:hypothetical protein